MHDAAVVRVADRFGPKPVVAASFTLGALAIVTLTLHLPLALGPVSVAFTPAGDDSGSEN